MKEDPEGIATVSARVCGMCLVLLSGWLGLSAVGGNLFRLRLRCFNFKSWGGFWI